MCIVGYTIKICSMGLYIMMLPRHVSPKEQIIYEPSPYMLQLDNC